MKELILGGARSGKSDYAEQRALTIDKKHIYLATGTAGDKEMIERIAHHQQRRGAQWQLVEEPVQLANTLQKLDSTDNVILIDCLTLWISNCLINPQQSEHDIEYEKQALLDILPQLRSDIFIVSNEVGSGIVPLGALSRQFVDHSGWLHQALAKICHRVTLVVAGLPLDLKK